MIRAMIGKLLVGLTPQQAGLVAIIGTFVTVIGAVLLAWAFRRWNAKQFVGGCSIERMALAKWAAVKNFPNDKREHMKAILDAIRETHAIVPRELIDALAEALDRRMERE